MNRTAKWTRAMQDASPTQFRYLLTGEIRKEQVQNAIAAGRSLARLLQAGQVTLVGVDDVQLERFRRRYAVVENLKGVMYAVATGHQINEMFELKMDKKFDGQVTVTGKTRLPEGKRCALCSKRTCRCIERKCGYCLKPLSEHKDYQPCSRAAHVTNRGIGRRLRRAA